MSGSCSVSGNVGEIGTEAGGSGTLRPLRLIGSEVRAGGALLTGVWDDAYSFTPNSSKVLQLQMVETW